MFGVLGFLPGFLMASILNAFGVLRVPRKVELEGLDFETEEIYRAAVDEVRAAELAMLKSLRRQSCRAF
jgi:ammonium transporter, Amt family